MGLIIWYHFNNSQSMNFQDFDDGAEDDDDEWEEVALPSASPLVAGGGATADAAAAPALRVVASAGGPVVRVASAIASTVEIEVPVAPAGAASAGAADTAKKTVRAKRRTKEQVRRQGVQCCAVGTGACVCVPDRSRDLLLSCARAWVACSWSSSSPCTVHTLSLCWPASPWRTGRATTA